VYARGRQAELVEEQDDFCMQIDAHTDAVPNWDTLLMGQWGQINNEYAVITSYPTNHKDLGVNTNNHWEMPHLCQAHFAGFGKVSNAQASAAANLQYPIMTPLWAAGLSFSRCHAERNVSTQCAPSTQDVSLHPLTLRGSLLPHHFAHHTLTALTIHSLHSPSTHCTHHPSTALTIHSLHAPYTHCTHCTHHPLTALTIHSMHSPSTRCPTTLA
jgi:hypothetical protein